MARQGQKIIAASLLERRGVESAKRVYEIAAGGSSAIEAVKKEGAERGISYKNDHSARTRYYQYRKLLRQECPEFYQEMVRLLGGGKESAERVATAMKDGAGAKVVFQGSEMDIPDHQRRLAAAKQETALYHDLVKMGLSQHQLELIEERNKLEAERNRALDKVADRQSPAVQIVLDLGDREQVLDVGGSARDAIAGSTSALPPVEETA